MNKIGLALSGGGFRASLYHLGLVRFLRDADLLSQVTHITSVSGGSIIAAHLVLNWDRYNGSPEEFDAVASEFLSFVDLDIRNRILRRVPLNISLRLPRRLLGLSNRKLTRTGLLESHYEKYLFGDKSLFELPERPKLHILTTNLSEGCLCSFNRDGLLMVRRQPEIKTRIDHIQTGLATVAMAVTSSSAFAGFFPPIELTGAEVGVSGGEFGRQAYTDGGVFDNLGVRMFRYLEPQILAESPLSRDDFFDPRAAFDVLAEAAKSSEKTPLRRLAQIFDEAMHRLRGSVHSNGVQAEAAKSSEETPLRRVVHSLDEAMHRLRGSVHANAGTSQSVPPATLELDKSTSEEIVLTCLWDIMQHHQFQVEPLFEGLKLADPDAEALLHDSRVQRVLEAGDQLWLNRHVLEAAFRQATGQPCFRRLSSGLDGVIVSDVGKRIEVKSTRHAGGLVRTALRATGILMERVWELENETFQDTPGFVFAPITEVVDHDEDPTALHPEIQRQVAHIRTDLDRFSHLEISSLIRHGYCVGRKVCREHPNLFGVDLPGSSPWDPIDKAPEATPAVPVAPHLDELSGEPSQVTAEAQPVPVSTARRTWRILLDRWARLLRRQAREPSPATVTARILQASSGLRIFRTFLDWRDWVSYIYVPLIVPIFTVLPYLVTEYYDWATRTNTIMRSLAQGRPEVKVLSRLLMDGPDKSWVGVKPEPAGKLTALDSSGFEILQESHILDLRLWNPDVSGKNDPSSLVHIYRILKVRKEVDNPGIDIFRFRFFVVNPQAASRFPPQALQPTLRRVCPEINADGEGSAQGENACQWEVNCDFTGVPAGEWRDILSETQSPGTFLKRLMNSTHMTVEFTVAIPEVTFWILMPRGRLYSGWRIVRHKKGEIGPAEALQPATEFFGADYQILAFKLLAVKPWYIYEIVWDYK